MSVQFNDKYGSYDKSLESRPSFPKYASALVHNNIIIFNTS